MVVMKGMNLTVNSIKSWFNINVLVILSPIFLKPFQTCGDTDTVLDSCCVIMVLILKIHYEVESYQRQIFLKIIDSTSWIS